MNVLFWSLFNLLACTQFVVSNFYMGMFKRNDFLVDKALIYKAASYFGSVTASYEKIFRCPITYFRVVDRLGMGKGPSTSIIRGGLGKKFIRVRMKSTYKLPISVNIYVGCENKMVKSPKKIKSGFIPTTPKTTTTLPAKTKTMTYDLITDEAPATTDDTTETDGPETTSPDEATDEPSTTDLNGPDPDGSPTISDEPTVADAGKNDGEGKSTDSSSDATTVADPDPGAENEQTTEETPTEEPGN